MSRFQIILNAQLTLIVYMVFGWCLQKFRLVSDAATGDLMRLVQWVTLPCLIVYSMTKEISLEQMAQAKWILIVSSGIMAGSYLFGTIAFQSEKDRRRGAVLRFGALASNCGSAGLSLLESVMGDVGLLYANLYALPSRIVSWSVGVSFFLDLPLRQRLKKALLNPSLMAILLGLLFQFWCPPLSDGIWSGISTVGKCTNPISMFAVGMILAQVPKKELLEWDIIKLTCLRLAVIPLVSLFILRLLRMDPMVTLSAVLLSGNPSAVVTVVMAEQYDGDRDLASKCIFVTSLCSIFTIIVLYMII